ncbi:MAG: hypothetical protein JWN12_427 [Candidatus Saccharibacteria bacterium]|nr:hypothetical protein [Candidatus Saccharibacteria bacterium]
MKGMISPPVRLKRFLSFARKNWFIGFAVAVYIFFTAFYMGPAFYNCSDSIYGFGDSTAGPIWRNSLMPVQPVLGGYEDVTNYPSGESLYSPVGYASLVQSVVMKETSRVVGPVCSYNLHNIFGYITTSVIMFAFILYLTKNRWIALLAGYTAAFTPYIQNKIGDHPSYGYASLLIAALWLLIHLISYRKRLHAVLLAIVLGICAYFDPYFILLAITIILPVIVAWGLISLKHQKVKKTLSVKKIIIWARPFLLSLAVFAVVVSPLLVVRVVNANLISSSVASVRGSVEAAAMQCSNKPLDYLLPDPNNIFLKKIFGPEYTANNISIRNWCGYAESHVSISVVMLFVIVIGGIVLLWERLSARKIKLGIVSGYDSRYVVVGVLLVVLAAFAIGLPPYINGMITPSGIILKITETWRIFAREYLVLEVALVVLFAVVLKYFSTSRAFKNKKILLTILFIVIALGIIAEYQVTHPFNPPVFSYSRDVPEVYKHIRDDSSIKTIAEYPIDRTGVEYDSIVYYLTMQAVHGKQILNSAAIGNASDKIHNSIKDLSDPQTLPVLRALGIGYVVIHGEDPNQIRNALPGLEIIDQGTSQNFSLQIVRPGDDRSIVLAKIKDGPKADNVLTINTGNVINLPLLKSPDNMEYELSNGGTLGVNSVAKSEPRTVDICFDVKGLLTDTELSITIGDKEVMTQSINENYTSIRLQAKTGDTLKLTNSSGNDLRLNNLGCSS